MARLFPDAEADGFAEVHGVIGRIGGDARGILCDALYAVAAGHADHAVRLGCDEGLHLALDAKVHAAVIGNRRADDLFSCFLQCLCQCGDLRLTAGVTCRCAAVAADDCNCLRVADHRHELFHGLLLRNNHANVSLRMKCGRVSTQWTAFVCLKHMPIILQTRAEINMIPMQTTKNFWDFYKIPS